ncbi:MAG: histidinol-phosphate transaminase [Alphaproteobacteria bacterium]
MSITPKPGVLDIAPYKGGRAVPTGIPLHRLAANESPLGPSPKAIEAYHAAAKDLRFYPNGGATPLRDAIAKAHGLDPKRIVCGNGSDELIYLLANCYLRPGDEAVCTEHAFVVYAMATRVAGAAPAIAEERDRAADVDAILAKVTSRTRIVFLANPNNPTGTWIPAAVLRRLHAGLAPNVLFVLDSAYAEYVRRSDYEAGVQLVNAAENVVMLRTFSKVYGLAGLRVGWAYCPPHVADALARVRPSFNVNHAAQAAAAAALEDRAHTEAAVRHNDKWLPWLTGQIRALGLEADDSAGNFLLVRFADASEAEAADAFLLARGLILRPTANYGLPNCLRLTAGNEEANKAVIASLSDFLRRA